MFDEARRARLWRPTKPWRSWRAYRDAALHRFVNEQVYPFSAYYRRVFDENKIDPKTIRSVDDLRRLPFTTKADIAPTPGDPAPHLRLVLQPDAQSMRKYATLGRRASLGWARLVSGPEGAVDLLRREYAPVHVTFTTGRTALPTQFVYAASDFDRLGESGKRLFDTLLGSKQQIRTLDAFPYAPHLAFWQTVAAGLATTTLALHTGGGKAMGTAGNLAALERMQPTMLVGVPGYVYHLLRSAVDRRMRVSSLTHIVLGAERAPPALKLRLAELCGQLGSRRVVVQGTYGFTEARHAWAECPPPDHDTSYGYHTFPDFDVFEIVDPKTGEPVGEGERGEIVFSNLAGRGSCVLRYRTGDIADGGIVYEPCPGCRRVVPRISTKVSRASDVGEFRLTKIRGTLVDLNSFLPSMAAVPEVVEWQLTVRKVNDDPDELDELVLSIAVRDGVDQAQLKARLAQMLLTDTEVAPNRIDIVPLVELESSLGLDTRMKELRIRDIRRPSRDPEKEG
jgi:phenylacetate-CoA ligase